MAEKKVNQKNRTLQKFSFTSNSNEMMEGNMKKIAASQDLVSQNGGNTATAVPRKLTNIDMNIVKVNDNLIRINKNIMNSHRHVLEIKKILKVNSNNINTMHETMIYNFDKIHEKLDNYSDDIKRRLDSYGDSGGLGGLLGGKNKKGIGGLGDVAGILRLLLPLAAGSAGVGLSLFAGKEFIKNSRTNDTGLGKVKNVSPSDRDQGRDFTNKAVGGAVSEKGIREAIALGIAKGTEEFGRERNRAAGLGKLPSEGRIASEVGDKISEMVVGDSEKDVENFSKVIAAAAASNLFGSDSDKNNFKDKILKELKGLLGGTIVGSPNSTVNSINRNQYGGSGIYKGREHLFPRSFGVGLNGPISAAPFSDLPGYSPRGSFPEIPGLANRFGPGPSGNGPYIPRPSGNGPKGGPTDGPAPDTRSEADKKLGFTLPSTGGKAQAVPGVFSGKTDSTGTYGQGALTADAKGDVDPVSFYKRTRDLLENSSLKGFVPPDGEKFGIKTGSADEWARLITANTKQESSFNINVAGDGGTSLGLGQMSVGDGAKIWGKGLTGSVEDIKDPEKAVQAIVKAHEYLIKKDGVIAGHNGQRWTGISALNGSYRRPHETLKHLGAAGKIAESAGPVPTKSNYDLLKPKLENDKFNPAGLLGGEVFNGFDPSKAPISNVMTPANFGKIVVPEEGGLPGIRQFQNLPHGLNTKVESKPEVKNNVIQRQGDVAEYRKLPISDKLQTALNYISNKNGVYAEIFSGGQKSEADGGINNVNRTGSTRHDDGNAADLRFYRKDENGKKVYLDSNNKADREVLSSIISDATSAGITGIGHGPGYMGNDWSKKIHLGYGTSLVWGAGGSAANAQEWVQNAYNKGLKNPIDINKWAKQAASSQGTENKVQFTDDPNVKYSGNPFGVMGNKTTPITPPTPVPQNVKDILSYNQSELARQGRFASAAFENVTGANMIAGYGGSVGNVFDRTANIWTNNVSRAQREALAKDEKHIARPDSVMFSGGGSSVMGPSLNGASIASTIEKDYFNSKATGDLVKDVFKTEAKDYFGPKEKDVPQSGKAVEAGSGPSLQRLFNNHFGLDEDEDSKNDGKWN